jgi:hypothetical protein
MHLIETDSGMICSLKKSLMLISRQKTFQLIN